MTRRSHPLIVIGGGPAGIAAAVEAARAGLTPMLLDEAPRLGGQVYRQPLPGFRVQAPRSLGSRRLRAEFEEIADRITVRSDTIVLAVSPDREVLWARDGRSGVMFAERLIIATGAYEHPVPFEAVLNAWSEWDFVQDAWENAQFVRRAGIPVLLNHTVFEAHGREEVQAASFGAIDPRDWRPFKATAQTEAVDLVCAGFGFVPNTELTVLAGCRQRYADEPGGWVPVRDAMMATTVPGIFAAGDGAGIAGAPAAIEEGRVAGIAAAEEAGAIAADEAARRRAGPLERLRLLARAREALKEASSIRPGLLELATPQTLACRCEEVSLAQVRAALDAGARDLQSIKLLTRLGMGPCQGRNCAPAMGLYVSHAAGRTPEQVGRINPRPPVKPVTLAALAKMAEMAP